MFTNTIDNKPVITKNDEQLLDLTVSIFNNKPNATGMQIYRVPDAFAMRADLISQAVYNTPKYAEFILKYNSISNPFSLNPGDIIMIPNIDDILAGINTDLNNSNNSLYDNDKGLNGNIYIDPDKKPKQSKENTEYNNRNINDDTKLPNIAEENENQITIRGGKIFFGDVNKIPCNSQQGMTVGDYLTNIIKNV